MNLISLTGLLFIPTTFKLVPIFQGLPQLTKLWPCLSPLGRDNWVRPGGANDGQGPPRVRDPVVMVYSGADPMAVR